MPSISTSPTPTKLPAMPSQMPNHRDPRLRVKALVSSMAPAILRGLRSQPQRSTIQPISTAAKRNATK